MNPQPQPRGANSRFRVLAQMVIILSLAIALGLVYNAISPDGIPLVKKAPTLHLK